MDKKGHVLGEFLMVEWKGKWSFRFYVNNNKTNACKWIILCPFLTENTKKIKEKEHLGFGHCIPWLRYVFASIFDNFYVFVIVAKSTIKPMLQFLILIMILKYTMDEFMSFVVLNGKLWKVCFGLTYVVFEFLMKLSK